MAPLEKRAFINIFIWGFALAGMLIMIFTQDMTRFDNDQGFRLIYDSFLIIGGIIVLGITMIDRKVHGRKIQLDERDLRIVHRASFYQQTATILLVAFYAIAGTEYFRNTGMIPVMYLYPFFLFFLASSQFVNNIILVIGYRRFIFDDSDLMEIEGK